MSCHLLGFQPEINSFKVTEIKKNGEIKLHEFDTKTEAEDFLQVKKWLYDTLLEKNPFSMEEK